MTTTTAAAQQFASSHNVRTLSRKLDDGDTTHGSIIAMLPGKGGAGATFIATNLAHALALEGKRVCLIDLNLHFGEASLYVSDSVPPVTVVDIAAQIERLDGALLESSMLRIAPNYWLLAAPDTPEKAVGIGAATIERILGVARNHFDFVILDVSRALDANSIKALDCADHIYLVMQLGLPFIRDGRRLLNLFRSLGYPDERTHLLVNRYEKGGDISLRDAERSLGAKVAQALPNSFNAVAISINQGRPVIDLAPRDPISRALRDMARNIARTPVEQDNWLRRRLKQLA
jgi:pilus assembly protein CpaE